ncbi:MAG: hypothetical protein HYV07_31820 [Deltaproteobacteria bacterium]|nr:hypothetical protein [Deltaproteobacteria bacterium]
MDSSDLTIEILKEIRDEGRKTNERLDQTNERLDKTNERLDSLRSEVIRRIADSEIRTATAITTLSGYVQEMTSVLRSTSELRPRVERCEQEIEILKKRDAAREASGR